MKMWIIGIFGVVAAFVASPVIATTAAEKLNPPPEADVEMKRNYRDTWRWLELMNGEVENDAAYYFFVRTGTDIPEDLEELGEVFHVMNRVYESMRKEDVEMLFVGRGSKEKLERRLDRAKANFPACHDDAKGVGAIPGYRSRPLKGITVVDADGNLVAETNDLKLLENWRSIIMKWEAMKKARDNPGKVKSLLAELLPGQEKASDVSFGNVNINCGNDTVPEDEQQQLDGNSSNLAKLLCKLDEDQASLVNTSARYFVAVLFDLKLAEGNTVEMYTATQNFRENENEKLYEIAKTHFRSDVQLFYVTYTKKNADAFRATVGDDAPVYNREEHPTLFRHPSIVAACSHDIYDLPSVSVTRALDTRILAEGRKPVVDDLETLLTAEEAKQGIEREQEPDRP